MKKIFKYLSILSITIVLFGCSNDYFDVDTPSNGENYENLALKDILAPTIAITFNAQFLAVQHTEQLSQHLASSNASENGTDRHFQTLADAAWTELYLQAMTNLKIVERKSIDKGATHYKGIAHTLMAINLGLATDLWGNVPYSQAFKSNENLYPVYDSQQSVYTEINNLLTQAIAEFSAVETSIFKPGAEDLIYAGNITKWKKAAYTFRARFALHFSKKNGGAAVAPIVLADLANGISSNAEDFQLNYNSRNINPWYSLQSSLNTGNLASTFFVSKHFVSNMDGTNFPFSNATYFDPRMYRIVDIRNYPNPTSSATNPDPDFKANYKGAVNGSGGSGANARVGVDFFYSKIDSPMIILSYSEALFMKAESEFFLAGGTTTSVGSSGAANTAYLAGIAANMDKVGVTAVLKAPYMVEPTVNVGTAGLTLKHIMREKFTTLFLNTEAYNDKRRYDFSTNVFPNLALPLNKPTAYGTGWVKRFKYPDIEANTNATNYGLNIVNGNNHITSNTWLYQ